MLRDLHICVSDSSRNSRKTTREWNDARDKDKKNAKFLCPAASLPQGSSSTLLVTSVLLDPFHTFLSPRLRTSLFKFRDVRPSNPCCCLVAASLLHLAVRLLISLLLLHLLLLLLLLLCCFTAVFSVVVVTAFTACFCCFASVFATLLLSLHVDAALSAALSAAIVKNARYE